MQQIDHWNGTFWYRPMWFAIAAALAVIVFGCTVLTAIFLYNPSRFSLYALPSGPGLAAALVSVALYCGLLVAILRFHARMAWLIFLMLVIRIGAYLCWGEAAWPGTADPSANVNIAANILAGEGIVLTNIERFLPTTFRAMYPPLYPVLLAGTQLILGQNAFSVFVLNTAVDAATAYVIWMIGRECMGEIQGRIAAGLYFSWPTAILMSLTAQKETTAVLFAALCMLAFLQLRHGITLGRSARLGLWTALLALTQPAWLPFVACLGVVFIPVLGVQATIRAALYSIPVFLMLMLPWWIRNWLVFDSFVPLSSSYGINLLFVATNRLDIPAPYFSRPGASELEGARLAWNLAIEIIRDDPLRYLRSRVIDTIYAWCLNTFTGDMLRVSTIPRPTLMAIYNGSQISHLVLVVIGFLGLLRSGGRSRWAVLLGFACFLQLVLFQSWFEYSQRHRYIVTPVLVLFAAAGLRQRLPSIARPVKASATAGAI